jgi:SRSO17 transposase
MDRRYQVRLEQMLAQAEVDPVLIRGLLERLETFAEPFVQMLHHPQQAKHAAEYMSGLLSKLERKTAEGIAYLHDQDRKALQKFVGETPWDHKPLLATLAKQVGEELGEPDGVIVFDPSAFPKKGVKSVGVARQWCGRLGKVENCQVAVYMAYVSRKEHAMVNMRLFLPREWTKSSKRLRQAGVSKGTRFRTRHQLALEMLEESGGRLPHRWVTGDDEMGRPSSFRRELRARGERYLLAVPSNLLVRDLEAPEPEYAGRGRYPKTPFQRLDRWCAAQPESAWTRLEVRDGEKGPMVVECLKHRVQPRTETGGTGPEELLFITREHQSDNSYKHDYYFSNAAPSEPLEELGRVAKAEHRIEECIERGKGEAGLGDYQVRTWPAWHHHQTLSLLAAWFLNQETRRGKNPDPRSDPAATSPVDRRVHRALSGLPQTRETLPVQHPLATP